MAGSFGTSVAADWRKMKGIGTVRLPNGRVIEAELHRYEAHGVGKRKMKIKRYVK